MKYTLNFSVIWKVFPVIIQYLVNLKESPKHVILKFVNSKHSNDSKIRLGIGLTQFVPSYLPRNQHTKRKGKAEFKLFYFWLENWDVNLLFDSRKSWFFWACGNSKREQHCSHGKVENLRKEKRFTVEKCFVHPRKIRR